MNTKTWMLKKNTNPNNPNFSDKYPHHKVPEKKFSGYQSYIGPSGLGFGC